MIFNQSGGSASPTLQTKTVSPSTSSQLIVPDAGFDALSQVTVNAAPLQAKTATIGGSQTIIKPDSGQYGLSQVTVPAAALQSKTVTPSSSYQTITPSSGYYGLSSVGVSAVNLTSTTVVPRKTVVVATPPSGYLGFSSVSVQAITGVMNQYKFTTSDVSFTKSDKFWRMTFQGGTPTSDETLYYGMSCCLDVVTDTANYDLLIGGQIGDGDISSNTTYHYAMLRNESDWETDFFFVKCVFSPRDVIKPNVEITPCNARGAIQTWESIRSDLAPSSIMSIELNSDATSAIGLNYGVLYYF